MLNKPMRTKKRGRDIVATLLYHLDNDTIILVLQCSFRWSSYLTCCRPKTRKEDERWWESSWLARDTRFSNFYTVATIAYFSTRYQVSSFGMAAAATNEQAPGQPIHKQKPLNTEADSVVVAVVELDSLPYTAARDNAVSVVISTSLCIRSDSKKSIHWILLWMWNRVPAYLAPWNTTGHVRFLWSSFWQTYNAHTPEFRSDWYTESAQYHHNTGHTLCHNSPWMTTTEKITRMITLLYDIVVDRMVFFLGCREYIFVSKDRVSWMATSSSSTTTTAKNHQAVSRVNLLDLLRTIRKQHIIMRLCNIYMVLLRQTMWWKTSTNILEIRYCGLRKTIQLRPQFYRQGWSETYSKRKRACQIRNGSWFVVYIYIYICVSWLGSHCLGWVGLRLHTQWQGLC